jgi:hypothetical protein
VFIVIQKPNSNKVFLSYLNGKLGNMQLSKLSNINIITYKAHTVSKCNIKSTKIKDILKHAEAISNKDKINKQH